MLLCYHIIKRPRRAGWGRMSAWLEFHIFTGVFGPFLVLLHSSWKFNGLAGLVLLMTVLIVFSGFVGRYIYNAIPRSVDGIELEAGQVRSQIRAAEAGIVQYLQDNPQARQVVQPLLAAAAPANTQPLALLLAYPWLKIRTRLVWWSARRKIDPSLRPTVDRLAQLARRCNDLYRQVRSLVMARRMMSLWQPSTSPWVWRSSALPSSTSERPSITPRCCDRLSNSSESLCGAGFSAVKCYGIDRSPIRSIRPLKISRWTG
jgi:hypothetical protein